MKLSTTWQELKWNLVVSAVVTSAAATLFILWKKRKDENFPPGPFAWPVFGNLHLYLFKGNLRLTNLKNEYGDIYSLMLGRSKAVVVCSLDGVLEALECKGRVFSDRPNCPYYNELYDGDRNRGFMTADLNELTHQKRKFLQDCLEGPFSLDENVELKITAEVMNVALNCLADKKLFNPLEIMRPACLNITLALVFGQRYMYNKRDRNFNEIMQSLRLRLKYLKPLLSDFLPLPGFFKQRDPSSIKERTSLQFEYQRKLINHHKDSFNPNALRDLTDQLLMYVANDEDKGLFECSDMETLLLDLLGAGFETTAITITWLLGYMAMFPAIQAQVQKEIDLAVGRDELPSLRDQIKLPYTMATILECQRMACVLPFLFPHKASRSCILKGYHIPKGTWLLCNVWSIHYDPRYWKNPKKFDPTRFLNDEQKLHIPDCFLPYGAGLRECPGQTLATSEIFLFFSLILHQMVVRSPDDTAPFHLQGELDIMHYPKAFKIKVIKRED